MQQFYLLAPESCAMLAEFLTRAGGYATRRQLAKGGCVSTGHPIMQNMHKLDDEKRMIVILPPDRYDDWLTAPAADTREFLQLYPAELLKAEPRPAPPRGPQAVAKS